MTNEKLEFVFAMAKHSTMTLHDCKRLLRFASTHQRLSEEQCNRELTDAETRKLANIRKAITTICHSHGGIKPILGGDPRGCTVKLQVPDGYTNDWGSEGICVPA